MKGSRTDKVGKQIQKDLGDIFQQLSNKEFQSAFITVMEVRVSPDIGYAKVYISILGPQSKQIIFELIQQQNAKIRRLLAERLKNNLRKIPELVFYLDDTLDQVEHIERLLNGLKIE